MNAAIEKLLRELLRHGQAPTGMRADYRMLVFRMDNGTSEEQTEQVNGFLRALNTAAKEGYTVEHIDRANSSGAFYVLRRWVPLEGTDTDNPHQ